MDNNVDDLGGGTLLDVPAPLTPDERKDFLASHTVPDFAYHPSASLTEMMSIYVRNDDLALIKKFTEDGSLTMSTIQGILLIQKSDKRVKYIRNMLLVGQRLESQYGIVPNHHADFGSLVRRLTDKDNLPHDRVSTYHQLAGYTAVTAFGLISVRQSLNMTKTPRNVLNENGTQEYQTAIANPHLEQLLRDRPEHLQNILDYIAERGMHRHNKTPVNDLRGYLDSIDTASSVAEGWL